MTKTGHQKFIRKFVRRNIYSVPRNSAPGLRLWSLLSRSLFLSPQNLFYFRDSRSGAQLNDNAIAALYKLINAISTSQK